MSAPQILEALTVTAELTGTLLSEHAKAAIVEVLLKHPLGAVMSALDRCRRDLSGRLTLAAILERLESADGRPGPDEAWATALEANDENETVVWSTEMRDAFSLARPVLTTGDKIGARMAFKDAYNRLVRENRERGQSVRWVASLGWDEVRREQALCLARERGRLSAKDVAGYLGSAHETEIIAR